MKKVFTILIFTVIANLSAQELKFEQVVKVDSTITKNDLFNIARAWAKENYSSNDSLVSMEDVKSGEISGIGIYDYRATKKYMGFSCVEGPISYKFSLFVKDGKYKYVFHSFNHKGSRGPGCKRVDYGDLSILSKAPVKGSMIADDYAWLDLKEKIKVKIETLVSSLGVVMSKIPSAANDW